MHFRISQKEFLEGVQIVQRAVSNKNTLPILAGILIKTEDTRLKLVATDLELGIECYKNAEIMNKGELVLPVSHLAGIVRELPNSTVEVKCNLQTLAAEIVCGNSRFNINGFPADDFPVLPQVEEGTKITLREPILKELIEQVKIATSTDETQPFLNGALIRIEGQELNMASTNSYRLAHRLFKLESAISEKLEVIIPNKTLDEMAKILDDDPEASVKVQITNNHILFEMDDILIISRLIEGKFPNYDPVIPKNPNTFITFDRKKMLHAVKRVALIAASNSNIIRANLDHGMLILESADSEIGKAHEELAVDMEGPEVEISFNAAYLMDGLKVLKDDEIQFCFTGKLSPFIVRPVSDIKYTYVISPIRS